jgi:hypothetical protein
MMLFACGLPRPVLRKYFIRGAKSYLVSDFVESADGIIRIESPGSIEVSLERIQCLRGRADIPSPVCVPSPAAVAAENLFLRKQLALYMDRQTKPWRATDSIRFTLGQLCRFFDWRHALVVVKPDTLIRWHRKGFRLFWKWKSRPRGRRCVPANVRELIAEMANSNPTWGEERMATELLLKIGIQISPRTVRRYMPKNPKRPADPSQRMDDVRAQSCQSRHRLRFLRRRDGDISVGVRVRHYGSQNEAYSSL